MPECDVGTVLALWRYPVKSMLGEELSQLNIDERGVVGDRLFAVRTNSGKLGSGKTTRRFERVDGLFGFRAWYDNETPAVRFPSSVVVRGDDPAIDQVLSHAVGRPVSLVREGWVSHLDAGALHLLTTASLRWLQARAPSVRIDARRFRPNVVLEVEGERLAEDGWVGHCMRLGNSVVIRIEERTERCVMPNLAQDDLPADPSVLGTLADGNDVCFGVYATVLEPGTVDRGAHAYLI